MILREAEVGDTIDRRYVLERAVARGAMGAVFQARHVFTGRAAAVKVLPVERSSDPRARARLLREAEALGAIRNAGVVDVLDAGEDEHGDPYLAMEMLEGRTLDGILTAGRVLSVQDTVAVGLHICASLEAVHRVGAVHRDVKPANVFVARGKRGHEAVKLIDFGIALVRGGSPDREPRKLTRPGELLGTPEYMAPEQLTLAERVDHRSDLYALGVTLFECLVGDVPHAGTYPEVLVKVSTAGGAPSLRAFRPDVPKAVAAAVERALAKDPAARYGDAAELGRALAESAGGAPRGLHLLGLGALPGSEPPAGARGHGGTLAGLAAAPSARRRHARAPYVTPVRIIREDGELIEGRTEDVSEGGLFALVPHASMHDGEIVRVEFAPPGRGARAHVEATARWVRSARSGKGAVGLELRALPDDARGAIASYVAWMND